MDILDFQEFIYEKMLEWEDEHQEDFPLQEI